MPISPITIPGDAVYRSKINEIIAAVNQLQTLNTTPVIWGQADGANTLTLELPAGTWIIAAAASAYEINGSIAILYIDGDSVTSGHTGNDDGGLNLITYNGIKEVTLEVDGEVDVVIGGCGGVTSVTAVCYRKLVV